MGIIFVVVFALAKLLSNSNADMSSVILFLESLEAWHLVLGAVLVTALILIISYLSCVRIINKKEY